MRQRVIHKKTFFFIEQLILKHNAHEKCLKIEEIEGGLDFFFKNKTHAVRIVDFLQSTIAVQVIQSKQLVSNDENSNTHNYKFTFLLELPRVCKDDITIIPQKLQKDLGGCSSILICKKVI